MAVDYGFKDLLHEMSCSCLGESSLLQDKVKQLPSSTQLSHKVYLLHILKHLEQFQYIRVINRSKYVNLSHEFSLIPHVSFYPRFQQSLHGPSSICGPVRGNVHFAEGAIPYIFPKLVEASKVILIVANELVWLYGQVIHGLNSTS
jgi:hypothetical protein